MATTFKQGEKVRTYTKRVGTVVYDVPDDEGHILIKLEDGHYLTPLAERLERVHPTRYLVEFREPKALEYIIPTSTLFANKAGLLFVHEGGAHGVKAFEGKQRFCVVESDVEPGTYEREPGDTRLSIEYRRPDQGDRYLYPDIGHHWYSVEAAFPDDHYQAEHPILVEVPAPRPVQYLVEYRKPLAHEWGINYGGLQLGAGDWTVLETHP